MGGAPAPENANLPTPRNVFCSSDHLSIHANTFTDMEEKSYIQATGQTEN